VLPTEAQRAFQQTARRFAEEEIAPHAAAWEGAEGVPEGLLRQMGALGFFGMLIPEEFGGVELDLVSYALATEEIAAADCGLCNLVNVSNSPVAAALRDHGTDAQRARWLGALATGEARGCFLLTEAAAGSDAAAIVSTATPKGDRYVLNGTKQFVTAGQSAQLALVIARAPGTCGKEGISAFLVPTDARGYRVVRLEDKLGHRNCDTAQIALEELEVSDDHRLGPEGAGYKIALAYLNGGRIGVAAQSVGVARAALDAALAYARERETFGKPILEHQAVAFKLAEMATQTSAARALTLQAAALEDAGRPAVAEASMAKQFASRAAEFVASEAIQIFGGYGYLRDFPVEKYYRDARVLRIYEGTNEIQQMVIARQLSRGWSPR
jgi:alkylation response protein AidB-like acyl-CoA dehydrogenase